MSLLQVLGIMVLVGVLFGLGFLFWVDSLGSSDDFRLTDYEAVVTVAPYDRSIRVQATLGLQALRKKPPKRISLALGIGAKVAIHSVTVNGEPRPYQMNTLKIPLLGERPELKIVSVTFPSMEGLKLSLNYTLKPLDKAGGFFSSITATEAQTEFQHLAFPILMFTLKDLWAVIEGDYSVLPRFSYRLNVAVPKGWEAGPGSAGKVESIIEEEDRKLFATPVGPPESGLWVGSSQSARCGATSPCARIKRLLSLLKHRGLVLKGLCAYRREPLRYCYYPLTQRGASRDQQDGCLYPARRTDRRPWPSALYHSRANSRRNPHRPGRRSRASSSSAQRLEEAGKELRIIGNGFGTTCCI